MDNIEKIAQMYDGQTRVFGHRGAMAYAPMNTIPAFELAYEQGAHGVELDVHRSSDGYPVIVHDFTVDAVTDGSGKVTAMSLDELKSLDAGSWFDEKFTGVRIPTLDEVFETVGQKLIINVEIKSRGLEETDGVEQVVADCIARHNMKERVIVSSFDPMALTRFREIMPDVPLGSLYMPSAQAMTQKLTPRIHSEAYHPHFSIINEYVVETAEANQQVVNAWTVNDIDIAVKLRNMGVHGLITNTPDVILKALADNA
ncbi:MAG: glycerophosphodiester phosphodiesterase [Aggregatilineales bacterium]